MDSLFSAEQIKIPPQLPEILKNYAKHVIKTQPTDIIACSAEYFGQLSAQTAQAKEGTQKLTVLQLEAFFNKLYVPMQETRLSPVKEIGQVCTECGVDKEKMLDILALGNWTENVPWLRFWSLLVAASAGVCGILIQTLIATIELAVSIAGDSGRVSVPVIKEIFMFLVDQDTKLDKTRVISAKEIFENMTARDIAEDELISSIKAALSDRVVAVEAIPEPSKPDSEDVLPEAAAVEQVSQVVSEPMEANPSGDQ